MKYAPLQKARPVPSDLRRAHLCKIVPLLEGARPLSDRETYSVLSLSKGKKAERDYLAFVNTAREVRDTYGATLELLGGPEMPVQVVARHEFRTTDKVLDSDLAEMVSTMGFTLSLRSMPIKDLPPEERYERLSRTEWTSGGAKTVTWYEEKKERTYVLREKQHVSTDVHMAARTARNFLAILKALRPALGEDMPVQKPVSQVVDISTGRPLARSQPVLRDPLAEQAISAMKTSL